MKAVFSKDEMLAVVDGKRYRFKAGGSCENVCAFYSRMRCSVSEYNTQPRCCRALGRVLSEAGCWILEKERKQRC